MDENCRRHTIQRGVSRTHHAVVSSHQQMKIGKLGDATSCRMASPIVSFSFAFIVLPLTRKHYPKQFPLGSNKSCTYILPVDHNELFNQKKWSDFLTQRLFSFVFNESLSTPAVCYQGFELSFDCDFKTKPCSDSQFGIALFFNKKKSALSLSARGIVKRS